MNTEAAPQTEEKGPAYRERAAAWLKKDAERFFESWRGGIFAILLGSVVLSAKLLIKLAENQKDVADLMKHYRTAYGKVKGDKKQ